MFFHNDKFFDFVSNIEKRITIPVIPALKILTSNEQLVTVTKHFYVDIPQSLVAKMKSANTKEEIENIGIEWAHQQCVELIEHGFNHIHFYIMKNPRPFVELMKRLGFSKKS